MSTITTDDGVTGGTTGGAGPSLVSESVLAGEFEGKNFIMIDVLDEEHLKLEGSQVTEPKETEESEAAVAQSQ